MAIKRASEYLQQDERVVLSWALNHVSKAQLSEYQSLSGSDVIFCMEHHGKPLVPWMMMMMMMMSIHDDSWFVNHDAFME